jgi:hypothetical protein
MNKWLLECNADLTAICALKNEGVQTSQITGPPRPVKRKDFPCQFFLWFYAVRYIRYKLLLIVYGYEVHIYDKKNSVT